MSDPVVTEEVKAKVPEQAVVIDGLDNAIPAVEPSADAESTQSTSTFEVPDKFKDKSPEEVIQSYVELEKMVGKQGSELGELRKITDEYILSNNAPSQTDNAEDNTQSDDLDFYSEPDKAVQAKVKEALKPFEQELIEMRQEKFAARLSQDHPDFEAVYTDENFHKWIQESPIRMEMHARADRDYNYDAANELFSNWKLVNQNPSQSQPDDATVSAATVESRDNAVDVTPKKLYRRADIIELKRVNPQRYKALESEILDAYREGRVVT